MDACPVCHDSGVLLEDPCPLCEGLESSVPAQTHSGPYNSGLCLVLDIDGTLLSDAASVVLFAKAKVKVADMRRFLRPHLQDFLDFAFESFDAVGIWTAACSKWLQLFLRAADPAGQRPWAFTWSARTRQRLGLVVEGCYPERIVVKPLCKIWRNGCLRARGYNRHSTLIIDDTPSVCRANYGNAIYIKTYDGDDDAGFDDWLHILKAYLLHLSEARHQGASMRDIEKRGWYAKTKFSGYFSDA